MQLDLRFVDIPLAEAAVWNQLDDEQRAVAIETLARVIVQIGAAANAEEDPPND